MKNSVIFYVITALAVICLVAGLYYLVIDHPAKAYVGIGIGAVLLIGGVVGIFMVRPNTTAR